MSVGQLPNCASRMAIPSIIKAVATIFEGQHDWLLHIKEEDGSIIKQRQSLLCEERQHVPQWLESFWEGADNLKDQYSAGDVVYGGPKRSPSSQLHHYNANAGLAAGVNQSLNEQAAGRPLLECTSPERQPHRDIYDQFLPEEWRRDPEEGRGGRPPSTSYPTGNAQDEDVDELFSSDSEDDLGTPVAPRATETPQPERTTVPSRRPRSPTPDDSDALAPPPKRSVFERRADRRRREEALGHRHLLAAERLPIGGPPAEPEQQTPQPEALRQPISIKARLGLIWSTVPLPPALMAPRSNSVSTSASGATSRAFRHRTALLTLDSESGELIERRWVRVRSSTTGESTNGSTAVAGEILSPLQERGSSAAAGSWAESPQTAFTWEGEVADVKPNVSGSVESPLASTSVQSSTPQVEDDLPDFEDLPEFEDVEPVASNSLTPDAGNRASTREVSELLIDPLGPQEARRWKLLEKPTVPDAPAGFTGIITGIKR